MSAPPFTKLDAQLISELEKTISQADGNGCLTCERDQLHLAASDESEDLSFLPEAVVFADTAAEVSAVLKFANRHRVAVTPRGGGTGLSGGALPVHGGVVLSLAKMNRIVEIDAENFFAVVEPGVITQQFQEEVEQRGLFYPPDPASRGSCTLGGNLAECAGGPRALKYGVTKDYVYGVEAVLPSGEIIQTGGKRLKDVTGYNLTQLLIGSEGTLGVITKVTLKLLARPRYRQTLMVPFNSIDAAAKTVAPVFMQGFVPAAMEIMEGEVVRCAAAHLGKSYPHQEVAAQLLVEVDGHEEERLLKECDAIGEVMLQGGAIDVLLADSNAKQEELWAVRRACGEAIKALAPYRELDTVVPRANLPQHFRGVKEICDRYDFSSYCYGHAGDGNLHVNILKSGRSEQQWQQQLPELVHKVFALTISLGGTISGEHGIGWVQRDYLPMALNRATVRVQQQIKQSLDPASILNPGKLFPDSVS